MISPSARIVYQKAIDAGIELRLYTTAPYSVSLDVDCSSLSLPSATQRQEFEDFESRITSELDKYRLELISLLEEREIIQKFLGLSRSSVDPLNLHLYNRCFDSVS